MKNHKNRKNHKWIFHLLLKLEKNLWFCITEKYEFYSFKCIYTVRNIFMWNNRISFAETEKKSFFPIIHMKTFLRKIWKNVHVDYRKKRFFPSRAFSDISHVLMGKIKKFRYMICGHISECDQMYVFWKYVS
jgi:hypothetical protein